MKLLCVSLLSSFTLFLVIIPRRVVTVPKGMNRFESLASAKWLPRKAVPVTLPPVT